MLFFGNFGRCDTVVFVYKDNLDFAILSLFKKNGNNGEELKFGDHSLIIKVNLWRQIMKAFFSQTTGVLDKI